VTRIPLRLALPLVASKNLLPTIGRLGAKPYTCHEVTAAREGRFLSFVDIASKGIGRT